MIQFRFYVVSVIAFFLALAVGIVMGSSLVDPTVVAGLRNQVDEVSADLDTRQAENDRLQQSIDELRGWVVVSAGATVANRLDGVVTVVVVDEGIDEGPVDGLTQLLETAGADVRGRLRLNESWSMEELDVRQDVADAIDVPLRSPAVTQRQAGRLVVADLGSTVSVSGDGTGAVDALVETGVIDFEVLDDVAVAAEDAPVLFVFVTGTGSALGDGQHLIPLAEAAADLSAVTVAAEVDRLDSGPAPRRWPERGAWLAPLRSSAGADAVSTADHLDVIEGPVATVLIADEAVDGATGQYGYSDDASGPVPVVDDE